MASASLPLLSLLPPSPPADLRRSLSLSPFVPFFLSSHFLLCLLPPSLTSSLSLRLPPPLPFPPPSLSSLPIPFPSLSLPSSSLPLFTPYSSAPHPRIPSALSPLPCHFKPIYIDLPRSVPVARTSSLVYHSLLARVDVRICLALSLSMSLFHFLPLSLSLSLPLPLSLSLSLSLPPSLPPSLSLPRDI